MPPSSIVASRPSDVPALVRLLTVSFADDAVVQHFLRQDARHLEAAERFFTLAAGRLAVPHGEVRHLMDPARREPAATALWVPPGHWSLGLREQLRLLPHGLRVAGRRRIVQVLRGLQAIDAAHPHEPHMYLSFLCTHPRHRGRGHGGRLLRVMTARCDAEGLPIYLENTKASNEAFYRHHGFEPLRSIPLPGGPRYYLGMWRRPQG